MGLDEPLPVTNVGMGYCVDQLEYDKPALTERYREFLGRGGWGLKVAFFLQSTAVCDNFFSDLDCRNSMDDNEKNKEWSRVQREIN